tara:strand:- start:621 stop:902 length:282 start_codon:yes stop_codon:yes gene_type:complete
MSPRILNSKKNKNIEKNSVKELVKIKNDLKNLRDFVEKNFEFVEKNFANKVREVYYDKNGNKNIYGSTTKEERDQLKEEGIDLVSLPWIEKDN